VARPLAAGRRLLRSYRASGWLVPRALVRQPHRGVPALDRPHRGEAVSSVRTAVSACAEPGRPVLALHGADDHLLAPAGQGQVPVPRQRGLVPRGCCSSQRICRHHT
jgi:hypothetical protein